MPPRRSDLGEGSGEPYSVQFFDLQLRFAQRIAEVLSKPFGEAVGSYTNLYVRLAMGPRLDASNAVWRRYLCGLLAASEPAAWTHEVHLQRLHLHAGPKPIRTEGCFSYEFVDDVRVRLHFGAAGQAAPLSDEARGDRMGELARLFAHLKASSGDDIAVVGASWLYNLDRYRCLFPERYLASLRPIEHPYQRMPLWGQFLRRDRTVRPEAGARFLAAVARAADPVDLAQCFPLRVLATSAPARWFYDHLGL